MTATTTGPAIRVYREPGFADLIVVINGDGYTVTRSDDDYGPVLTFTKDSGDAYEVAALQSGTPVTCQCKGWTYRKTACRHMRAAAVILQGEG